MTRVPSGLGAAQARGQPSWSYWRPESLGSLELCTVRGPGAALPTHFHHEAQLSFVVSGRRQFYLGGRLVAVPAGRGLIIPARVPHRSVWDSADVLSVNVYLPERQYSASAIVRDLRALRQRTSHLSESDLLAVLGDHVHGRPEVPAPCPSDIPAVTAAGSRLSVRELASTAGMSREGYSRGFRRRYGMSPHAHLLVGRLNTARDLLRAGVPIAQAAADCGFADQSHLGRWFRRTFGTTPGRYRRG